MSEVNVREISDRNDSAAIQTALTAAVKTGLKLKIPAGTYVCERPIRCFGESISIEGDGVGATRIIFKSGGFNFGFEAQGHNQPPQQLHMRGMTIEAEGDTLMPAVLAVWDRYQPNAQGSLWMSDLNITRGDGGTGSFTSGIRLTNCFVGSLRNIIMVGDDAHISEAGIDTIDCGAIKITDCDVNRYQVGARGRAVVSPQQEGLTFTACNFYDCDRGVDFDKALELRLMGCHVNINGSKASAAIRLSAVKQSFISNCLIYAGGLPGDPAGQAGVILEGGCNSVHVSGNELTYVGAASSGQVPIARGIVVRDSLNAIRDNGIGFFPIGIEAPAGNVVQDNTFFMSASLLH